MIEEVKVPRSDGVVAVVAFFIADATIGDTGAR